MIYKINATIFAIFLFVFAPLPSMAETGVDLQPIPAFGRTEAKIVMNIVGSCGGSIVRVQGFEPGSKSLGAFRLSLDTSIVIIANNHNKMKITNELSDYNSLSCVSTAAGDQLILAAQCAGAACGGWSYYMIDPRLLAFSVGKNEYCDISCIERRAGKALPKSVPRD